MKKLISFILLTIGAMVMLQAFCGNASATEDRLLVPSIKSGVNIVCEKFQAGKDFDEFKGEYFMKCAIHACPGGEFGSECMDGAYYGPSLIPGVGSIQCDGYGAYTMKDDNFKFSPVYLHCSDGGTYNFYAFYKSEG
ncbi:hypothetical protein [Endozoicomonas sp. 4G]|uniref:hypothetical protein n=1 Tax=Endozoicomonas sp. 4G TaxID=2872754 RepID=UPI0020790DA2|nr:hypothetical protein [Endozoicomonas sp. 4G]